MLWLECQVIEENDRAWRGAFCGLGGKCIALVEISGQKKLHVWSWHTRLIILMLILEKYDNDWIDLPLMPRFKKKKMNHRIP